MKGQSLIELLIVIALAMLLLPSIFTGLSATRGGEAQQTQRLQAIALLKETEEAVRSVREIGWTTFSSNGTYHPAISGSHWSLANGSETINGITRQVTIADAYRDTNGNLASTGTLDPSTKLVTTTVSWSQPHTSSIQSSIYLTRYLSNTSYTQTTVADFNAGTVQSNQVQVTNTSGGEIILGFDNRAKWCSPSFSSATIDLPDGPPVAVAATASAISTSIPNDVFTAVAPNDSTSTKLAYLTVTANTAIPTPTLKGTFTLDPTKYSSPAYVPSGINLTNSFKTNDVKYYRSTNNKLYALLATDLTDHEIIAVQINDGTSDTFQDPVNKIYKYWTFFNTQMYKPTPLTLINANFETGNISPYTTIINLGTGVISSTTVHAGTYAAKVSTTKTSVSGVSGGGNCSGGNRIAVTPDTTYSWSSYINIPSSGNTKFKDARVRIAWFSACTGGTAITTNDSNLITTTNQGWVQVTGSANSGSATFAEIQLLLDSTTSGTTSTGYFDDITMNATASSFNDQAPFGYGATAITIQGSTGYVDSGGYLYIFDLSNIDSKSPTNGLDQIGCRILLDGYDCLPNSGTDQKYSAGETGSSWSDTTSPAHLDCSDGGNIELNADHQLSAVQIGTNNYVYVAVGAGTNPELDIVDVSTPPSGNTLTANTCGRGSNTGWKVTGSLDFDPANGTEEAANSVYARPDGLRAYMSSNGGIIHNGIPDSDQFYIIDTSNKASPKFLSTWPSTVNGQHYANTAETGYYNGNSTNIELYPRRALTVLNGQRAVLVGQDGIPNDGIEPQEYQVLDLSNEATPLYCGGLNFIQGFNDLTSVSELDGDNFVYMVANTNQKQLKIVQGGPDTGLYVSTGTFISSIDDLGVQAAVNRIFADVNQPANTTIQLQVALAPVGNDGTCSSATYSFVGPDGTANTYFTPSGTTISGIVPTSTSGNYQNPARCLQYKAILSTTNTSITPQLSDVSFNYSP